MDNDKIRYDLFAARIIAVPPANADNPMPIEARCTVWATDAEAMGFLQRHLPTEPLPAGAHYRARLVGQLMPARYDITVAAGPDGPVRRQRIVVDLTRRVDVAVSDMPRPAAVAAQQHELLAAA